MYVLQGMDVKVRIELAILYYDLCLLSINYVLGIVRIQRQ